ncbi:MAG: heat-inducible transcription repressor HrcA [Deltaproteobacteria bacterium]|uniref:Heat-inducible transcription repressor HrcA n=1 Tax=Candidatus Zymogenus saltonus TaxID=2844893 RepID=A0A9D8KAE6_9DELT|nr:heat-inducible transcription repressor HrcA [Candidatus Zymogenus saltonus]
MIPKIGDRAREVLLAVIDDFIKHGEPVGSRTVSKRKDIDVSSATIRNIMSDLEEIGFLTQPHTSAGRVPTDNAFRFYVDSLIKVSDLTRSEELEIERSVRPQSSDIKDVIKETSRVLSEMSQYIALVSTPSFTDTVFRQIDFVRLTGSKILTILVSSSGMIYNKIINAEEELDQEKLDWMSRYLNDVLSDLTLVEVRGKILEEMQKEKNLYDELLIKALSISDKVINEEIIDDEIFIEGSANIFSHPEFTDINKMKRIFMAFENKHYLLKLLEKVAKANGIKVFIGSESKIKYISDCTIIASPYEKGGQVLGSIGVIGPMRMDYAKIIPVVDFAASLVSRFLEEDD